jgi:hypothetical protein
MIIFRFACFILSVLLKIFYISNNSSFYLKNYLFCIFLFHDFHLILKKNFNFLDVSAILHAFVYFVHNFTFFHKITLSSRKLKFFYERKICQKIKI